MTDHLDSIPHTDRDRRLQAFRTLLDVSMSLHQHLKLDALVQHVNRQVMDVLEVEAVSVFLHDNRTDELVLSWVENSSDGYGEILRKARVPVVGSIAGDVLRSGEAQLVDNVHENSRHYGELDRTTGFETRSMIVTPLPAKDKIIGVLEAINPKHGAFTEGDLHFLKSLASIVALALDNARVVTELDRAYKRLQEIDAARNRLFRKTREENLRLRREIESRYRFDQIKGCSDPMLAVFRLCEKAIDSDITVLIEGETGTGKELIARCIHYNSPRRRKPFVSENCGAIPESLLAGELFGHTRGAFTGATGARRGLFEVADGGTLFLDEVSEMSIDMQKSLLRVLQEGELRPLGSTQTKKVDVRVVSATNKSLEEEVEQGRFREDLYYRLSVFRIPLPPLRQRDGDVPLLTHHFVEEFSERAGKKVGGISDDALSCLAMYPFPGNIRELRNEIQRAVAMVEPGAKLDVTHFSERLRQGASSGAMVSCTTGSLKEMVESLERCAIEDALGKHQGNKTRAAKDLGLSRYGLIKKIQRYGL